MKNRQSIQPKVALTVRAHHDPSICTNKITRANNNARTSIHILALKALRIGGTHCPEYAFYTQHTFNWIHPQVHTTQQQQQRKKKRNTSYNMKSGFLHPVCRMLCARGTLWHWSFYWIFSIAFVNRPPCNWYQVLVCHHSHWMAMDTICQVMPIGYIWRRSKHVAAGSHQFRHTQQQQQ